MKRFSRSGTWVWHGVTWSGRSSSLLKQRVHGLIPGQKQQGHDACTMRCIRLVCAVTAALLLLRPATAQAKSITLGEPWGLYTGLGFSGSTYGRSLPGIHLAAHARYVEGALYSTGAASKTSSSSHQNLMLGFPFVMHTGSWLQVHNSFGVGWQHNLRTLDDAGQTQTSQDDSLGLAVAIQTCLAKHVCLRLQGHFGLSPMAIEQVYYENAMGSLGIAL